MIKLQSLFTNIPSQTDKELFTDLVCNEKVRVERIVSQGQGSPEQGWYNQSENEWVMVIKGTGLIEFENGPAHRLKSGDYLEIPAHTKHRVVEDNNAEITVWLAVFWES